MYHLNELVDWHYLLFNTNRYGDPVNLIFQKAIGNFAIDQLSTASKQMLLTRFKDYPELCNLVNSLEDGNDHSTFWMAIDKIDQVRSTSFKELCPEWSQLL